MAVSAKVWGFTYILISFCALFVYRLFPRLPLLVVSIFLLLCGIFKCIRFPVNSRILKNKIILITGCDSGIGLALTERLCSLEATVFAGCLNTEGKGIQKVQKMYPKYCHILKLDVTSITDVIRAVNFVDKHLENSGLWAVVNNAGVQFSGDVELTSINRFETLNNINYTGMVRVVKEFLPMLRNSKGRILNVSSCRARLAKPLFSAYTATKFAIEGFSDTLRLELERFGVRVVIMEPGHYGGATESTGNVKRIREEYDELLWNMNADQLEVYGEDYVNAACNSVIAGNNDSAETLDPLLSDFVDALASNQPKDRYLTAGTNSFYDHYKVEGILAGFIPVSVMDVIVKSRFKDLLLPKTLRKQ